MTESIYHKQYKNLFSRHALQPQPLLQSSARPEVHALVRRCVPKYLKSLTVLPERRPKAV